MNMPAYDIAISGAGPVGSTLALLLATRTDKPQRIALMGRRFTPSGASHRDEVDPRTLALNHGSRVLLEQLGAWPDTAADITTVHVSQRGRLGRTLIRHQELGVPRLGSVVGYDAVLASLHQALERSGITRLEGSPSLSHGTGCAEFILDGQPVRSVLAVQSDGARPQGIERQYGQNALLAMVRVSRPRPGWAFERFTAYGPLAFLPHPQGDDIYGVVWCSPPAEANRLLHLEQAKFEKALQSMFGDRLGTLHGIGDRHIFPLSMHAGPSLLNPRAVAIGNAAQTLHPVAGQGLNLGLRDAAQLSQALASWLACPSTDPQPSLARFARSRRPDRWLTAGVTDILPRVFATQNPLIEHACGLALLALDLLPPLRAPLARQLLQGLRN